MERVSGHMTELQSQRIKRRQKCGLNCSTSSLSRALSRFGLPLPIGMKLLFQVLVCYEQIQEDAAQDVINALKLEISSYVHTGTTYSGYGLLSKERDRILSAREAVQIGAALGYSEQVTRQYLKRGERPMNREWLTQEQLSEYTRKVAEALGRFMS